MDIKLLRNPSCNFWQDSQRLLLDLLKGRGIDVVPEVIMVDSDEKARQFRFFGSPQIVINGKDIDPMAERITNYHVGGCRIYLYDGRVYNFPPREMIEKALTNY